MLIGTYQYTDGCAGGVCRGEARVAHLSLDGAMFLFEDALS